MPLKEGGSIVIDPTEALVAIDVNSGNFRKTDADAEETAYQMNLQAAKEIARQLRLRDLGGVIVNDFIDMRREKHRRGVERALRDAMARETELVQKYCAPAVWPNRNDASHEFGQVLKRAFTTTVPAVVAVDWSRQLKV